METFGEWLRQQRSMRRLTREEFARRVGCSVSAVRKIEEGVRRPSAQIAELMANCLDIPLGERSTFVRVARGELRADRLHHEPITPAGPPLPRIDLPIFPTPLVGRGHEMEQLTQLLREPQCRLLTLVGPGGIGKTRLAVEAACSLQDCFADGLYFVPLASVGSVSAAISTAANAIHFGFHGPDDPKLQLLNYLQKKEMLLIVDNIEHLLAGDPDQETVAELLVEVLHQTAHVKLLATSRECLALEEEWVFEVQGLPVPESVDAEAGLQNTSVELFLQRARRAHVGFDPAPEDFPAILRTCQLADGMPLAIELAAAWTRVLSCGEIAAELEHGMDFLRTGARDIPARHRSMPAVFEQSWKLLTEEERGVLLQLSVFRGGFSREAAEQVAAAALAVLSALVTKSLVRRSGAGRYDLHELIRQFAASKLAEDPGEMRDAQERHSLHYLSLLERQGVRLETAQQKEAVAELIRDMDNIRAAWDWSIARGEFVRLYRVSVRLMHLFEVKDWFKEGETTFRKTVDSLRAALQGSEADAMHQVALNAMLAHRGFFWFRLGNAEDAYSILSPSAAFLRGSGEPLAAVYSHFYLGIDCWILGRFAEADQSLQISRAVARECGAHWFEALDDEFLGRLAIDHGQYEQARGYLDEALAILRRLGDPSMTAHVLSYLARTLQCLGEYRDAERLLRESLQLSQENGYRFATGLSLDGLGKIAYAEGRCEEAQRYFAESAGVFRDLGDKHRLSRTLNHQGLNRLALHQASEAQEDFGTALRLAYEGRFTPAALNALAGLAALAVHQEAGEETLELVLYILEHPASSQETRDLAARLKEELGAGLTPAEMDRVHRLAGVKTLDDFVRPVLTGVHAG